MCTKASVEYAEVGHKRTADRSRETGRFSQPPGVYFCIAFQNCKAKIVPYDNRAQSPNTALQSPGCVWMPPSSQTRHKLPHKADTGGSCLGVWLGTRFIAIGRDILSEKSSTTFHFFEAFREHQFWARELLFNCCRVAFSWTAHTKSNIFEHSHFCGSASSLLLFVLFIYFLPKYWRGYPPPYGG